MKIDEKIEKHLNEKNITPKSFTAPSFMDTIDIVKVLKDYDRRLTALEKRSRKGRATTGKQTRSYR